MLLFHLASSERSKCPTDTAATGIQATSDLVRQLFGFTLPVCGALRIRELHPVGQNPADHVFVDKVGQQRHRSLREVVGDQQSDGILRRILQLIVTGFLLFARYFRIRVHHLDTFRMHQVKRACHQIDIAVLRNVYYLVTAVVIVCAHDIPFDIGITADVV